MNIFALDYSPVRAAKYQCDKHVVKMVLETAQLLSTVIHVTQTPVDFPIYKATHTNHPCSIWARNSKSNWNWLVIHGISLCKEYNLRFGKVHKCEEMLWNFVKVPINLPNKGLTAFPQCMPDYCKDRNAIQAYRNYYINEKSRFAKWKLGNTPEWYNHEH